MRKSRENGLFLNVPDEQWNDWKWQVENRIETLEDLKKYITLTEEEEEGIKATLGRLRMAITPYYLSLIDLNDPYDPIRKQAIPTEHELEFAPYEDADPLHEDIDSPCPGLTHRYPDRVLLLITDQCSMYCRHCTRRRFAGQHDCEVAKNQIDTCIDYVRHHPEVRDVLLSGGDCLMVSDEMLDYIIGELRNRGDVVAMVGDGLNDAPSLVAADVGLAVSTGTDVAMEAAGITLMRGDPRLVADAIDVSRRTYGKIKQGLFWAFVYNTLGIPLAALGMLSPVVAGAAMAFSSVSVVLNALTLRRWRASAR